jgi:multidrug efflux pump subunit AcrA (membrane-fusion protein)
MSTTPTRPEMPQAETPAPAFGTPRWIPILFVIVFLLGGYLVYAGMQSHKGLESQLSQSNAKISDLGTSLQKSNSQIDDLKAELDLTSQKLGLTQQQLDQARRTASALRAEQLQASRKLQQQIGQVQQQTQASVSQLSNDLGGTKTDLAATKQALNDTATKLDSTIGDMGVMSGKVAHNDQQLQELIRLGERNYYKFDLTKAKFPTRIGPVMVQLTKVDTKHWRYNMYVTLEDKRIEKSGKTLYEPVQFYTSDATAPMELVVFQMKKNEAIGYLSSPKEQSKDSSATSAN